MQFIGILFLYFFDPVATHYDWFKKNILLNAEERFKAVCVFFVRGILLITRITHILKYKLSIKKSVLGLL